LTKNPRSGQPPVPNLFRGEWRALIALTDKGQIERILRALPPAVERRRVSAADAVAVSAEREDQLIFADLTSAEILQGSHTQSASAGSCPIVYLAATEVLETRWPDVARLRLCSLLDSKLVDDAVIFEAVVAGTLSGLGIDVQSLFNDCDSVDIFAIESESHRDGAVVRVLDQLRDSGLSPLQLTHYRLVMEELLTNAMRHALSAEKHDAADRRDADQSGSIHDVTLASVVTREFFAISVTDPAGALTADALRHAISRQLAGAGDFDSGGRGLFIVYSLANLLSVTVDPGRRTSVVALFRHALPEVFKAMIINARTDENRRRESPSLSRRQWRE